VQPVGGDGQFRCGRVLPDVHPVLGQPATQHRADREILRCDPEVDEELRHHGYLLGVLRGLGQGHSKWQAQRDGLLDPGHCGRPGPAAAVDVMGARAGTVK